MLVVTVSAAQAADVAGRLGTRLDTGRLRRWFGVLVLVVAAGVLGEVGYGLLAG